MRLITLYRRIEQIAEDWDLEHAICASQQRFAIAMVPTTGAIYSCPIDNPLLVYALYPEFQADLDHVIEGDVITQCCDRAKQIGLSKMVQSPEQSKSGDFEFGYIVRSRNCGCHGRWFPWEWQKHGDAVITGGKRIY